MQVLCDLRYIFLIFNCQTPELNSEDIIEELKMPDRVNAELFIKVLGNPKMATLLNSLARQ